VEVIVRFRLPALLAGLAVVAAGCSNEPTAPGDRTAADHAAQELLHLADSLAAQGNSASEVGAYRGLASLLMGTGRLSTVSISVDGAASEYLATAQEILIGGCPPGALCTMMAQAPIRSVVAWEKGNPRRVVQLFTTDFGGTTSFAAPPGTGMLTYLDGEGAMYRGTTTSETVTVTVSDTPCPPPDQNILALWAPSNCREAEFSAAFDGTLALIPLGELMPDTIAAPSAPDALPSHRVTMASQQVHGAHSDIVGICIDSCPVPNPPGLTPPVASPWRDSLTATLTASVGSDVTFTFTVKNTRSTAAEVHFNDAQQFDIRVWNDAGTQVWRWGAEQGFTEALVTRTLAPDESATYVEHWTPPAAGSYRAMAYLTSSTHAAVGFATFSKP
jgi:hypothetical protein